jgi:hypothetical protein
MKVKISELNSNPFKKDINKGKLKEQTIKKIQANIKELGLMGSIPVFKKDGKYFLIAGHHRIEALKRSFGKNYAVEVTLHNYSDENVLRGMVVENITQRQDEPFEVSENLALIRKYLKTSNVQTLDETKTSKRGRVNEGRPDEAGSVRNISSWLNANGEVMSKSKIDEYLKVYDNLDRSLLRRTIVTEGAKKEEGDISIEEAKTLARLDKKDQKNMQNILEKTGLDYKQKSKLVTEFLNSPEELKNKVLNEEIEITEVPIEKLKQDIKRKITEDKENNKGKITAIHFKQYQNEAGNKIGRTNDEIIKTCAFLNGLHNSGVLYDLDWKTMLRIVEAGTNSGKNYTKFMERIIDKIR